MTKGNSGNKYATGRKPRKFLSEKELKLIEGMLAGQDTKTAGAAAGYSAQMSYRVSNSPMVLAEISRQRAVVSEKIGYTLQAAARQFDEAIAFALLTENASAYVRGVEMKAKLFGMMIDKSDVRVGSFSINIGGIYDPVVQPKISEPPLDVDFEEVLK